MMTETLALKLSLVIIITATLAGCTQAATALPTAGQPSRITTQIPAAVPTLTATPTLTLMPSVSPIPTISLTPKLALSGVIAFSNTSRVYDSIVLLDLESGTIQNLSNNGFETVSFSPDGQWLVFDGGIPNIQQPDIYKVRPDGSEFTRLTNSPQNKYDVAWSPDGKSIVYAVSNQGNPSNLALLNVDSRVSYVLTSTKGSERFPAWSPDGKQIAYSYSDRFPAPPELWVMDANGKNARRLNAVPFVYGKPDWSPNGEWLAFVSGEKPYACGDIYIIRPDGSDLTRLTSLTGCANGVAWSPDGKYLAFIGSDKYPKDFMNAGYQIYIMDFESRAIMAVTNETDWHIDDIDWGLKTGAK